MNTVRYMCQAGKYFAIGVYTNPIPSVLKINMLLIGGYNERERCIRCSKKRSYDCNDKKHARINSYCEFKPVGKLEVVTTE